MLNVGRKLRSGVAHNLVVGTILILCVIRIVIKKSVGEIFHVLVGKVQLSALATFITIRS